MFKSLLLRSPEEGSIGGRVDGFNKIKGISLVKITNNSLYKMTEYAKMKVDFGILRFNVVNSGIFWFKSFFLATGAYNIAR